MNPRLSRLKMDYEKLSKLAARSPFVTIQKTEGDPPSEYVLRLTCKGIVALDRKMQPIYSESHDLRVRLHLEYPRRKPVFTLLTPIFHPNVMDGSGTVCIGNEGDHGYAPSMGLDDIVIRIIEMIRYENYSTQSVYNSDAAKWASRNQHLLPVDTRQIVGEELIEINVLDEIQIVVDSNDSLLDEITIL